MNNKNVGYKKKYNDATSHTNTYVRTKIHRHTDLFMYR